MFKLAPIFTNNMVLQRECEILIWGEAEENSNITAEICGNRSHCVALEGKFELILPRLSAGGPFELKVYTKEQEVKLENILIGEVWIAGGQSNMEFKLKDSIKGKLYISNSNYNEIRYFNVPQVEFEDEKGKIPQLDF